MADAEDTYEENRMKRPLDEETPGEDGDAPGEEGDAKRVKMDEQSDAMARAMAAVHALNAPGGGLSAAVSAASDIITTEVECPQSLVGKVIGKGGETIKQLQQQSGAKIQVDQNMPPGLPRKVIITGVAAAVATGERLVKDIMQSVPGGSSNTGIEVNPGEVFESIDCPKTLVGRVIGKGGETIRLLQMRSGTRIQIDQNGTPCKVMVTGTKSAVAVAVGMVKDLMVEGASGNSVLGTHSIDATAPGNMSTVLDCEKRLVGRIIGKGGETINYLQVTSGTRIQIDQNVPEGTPCKVSIAGPAHAVADAIRMVTDCMENGNGPPRDGSGSASAGLNPYGGRPQTGIVYGRPAVGGYGAAAAYGAGAYGAYGQSPYEAAAGYGGGYGGAAQAYGGQGYGGYAASPAGKSGAGYGAVAQGVWSEHSTDDGTKYWYNSQTGESTWTKPPGM